MTRKWTVLAIALLAVALCLAFTTAIFAGEGCGHKDKDQKLTIDQLPPAVKATLEAQAQGCQIEDLEKEEEDGKVFYSADIIKADGTKVEVEIAEDGTLLPQEEEKEKTCGDKDADAD